MGDSGSAHLFVARRHWYRLALIVTVGFTLAVLVLLPLAVQSMSEVLGRGPDPLYDLATGEIVPRAAAQAAETDATYINLGLVDLDAGAGQVMIAISGNRTCSQACPRLALTFIALDNDADQRRGLPPLATLTLSPDDRLFSQAVTLPVRGHPSLYPFDKYEIWLGTAGTVTWADGTTTEIRPETLGKRTVVTLQNRIPDMMMPPPSPIDPNSVHVPTDPFGFVSVEEIILQRPVYLQVLAVALVILIAISAALALLTRDISDLALGFGSIILGVWGVRSVLMPQAVSTVTAIDLALSWLILLLLLGLAVRAALHFHRQSGFRHSRPRRRR